MRQISLSRPQNQLNHEKTLVSVEVQVFYLHGVTNVMELVFVLQDLCLDSWLGVTKRINMPELFGHAHGVEMTSTSLQLQGTKK